MDNLFHPKSSKLHPNVFGVRSIFIESIGAVVMEIILSLKK